jgi:non-ribosomal peptide synthase protein (TIGR01720 family)
MATTKLRESLSLTEGPVIQIAYLDNHMSRPGHLLLVAHQLVMDQPSLEILLDDLSTAYQQLQQGQAVQLPPKTTPYKQWATQLAQESLAQAEQEVDYWHAQPWQQIILLPANQTNDEQEEGIPYSTQLVRFNPAESHFLLQEAAAHYNVEPIDVLLTALAQTMTSWANSPYLFLERPLNGRQLLSKMLDLSHTVGEFTIYAPLLLHLSNSLDIEEALKHVKEQLRHLPPHGLTYAVLCTLDQHEKLPMLPDPQLVFSFEELNKPDRPQSNLFKRTTTLTDSPPDFHTIRPNQLGLFGYIVDNQLEIQWRYQDSVYQSTTVAQWAQRFLAAIQAIMTHLQADKKEVLTPSDFPEAGLSQTALDKFLAKFGQS